MTDAGPRGGPVLLVGYGNPLRADDGAGPEVARLVAADPRAAGLDIDVRVEHQLVPELAVDIAASSLLVLVDAAAGAPAGELSERRIAAPAPDVTSMTHHVTPERLLGLSSEVFGKAPRAVLLSIGVRSLGVAEGLTPEVAAATIRAAGRVLDIVEEHRRA